MAELENVSIILRKIVRRGAGGSCVIKRNETVRLNDEQFAFAAAGVRLR